MPYVAWVTRWLVASDVSQLLERNEAADSRLAAECQSSCRYHRPRPGLAQREYALGLEALDRAARGEPLWRVHECVFVVLALESKAVAPRL